jgi:hypothetical protein
MLNHAKQIKKKVPSYSANDYKNKTLIGNDENMENKSKYIPPYMRRKSYDRQKTKIKKHREILGHIIEYQEDTAYRFCGLISCVGLVITGYNKFHKHGLGVHVINSKEGHFNNNKFTLEGKKLKKEMISKIKNWGNIKIKIKFYKVPMLNGKYHLDTLAMIKKFKSFFKYHFTYEIKFEEIESRSCCNVIF